MDELLTIPEAAALIRVSQETVRRRIRSGALSVVSGSGPRSQRVRKADLLAERGVPYGQSAGEPIMWSEAPPLTTLGEIAITVASRTSRRLDAQASAAGLDRNALADRLLDDALTEFEDSVAGIRRGEIAGAEGREIDFDAYVQRDRDHRTRSAAAMKSTPTVP